MRDDNLRNIYFTSKSKPYVQIRINGRLKYFGLFPTVEDAIKKRDEILRDLPLRTYNWG